MAVRNCAEIGENLQKIVNRLLANNELVKLLYYEDQDPLGHDNLTEEQKNAEVFGKLIKVIPKVTAKENVKSIVAVRVANGRKNGSNDQFRDITFSIEVFVPFTQWMIKDTNLRPFAILGEIQKSLDNKLVNGLGKLVGGDFALSFLTEEMSCYETTYEVTVYD